MSYTLRQLEAAFVRHVVMMAEKNYGKKLPDGTMQWGGFNVDYINHIETLAEAQGLWFACPLCFAKNNGIVGTHYVCVWFHGRGVPDHIGHNTKGETTRWNVAGGSTLDDLQLTPSILLDGPGCGWHGFVGSSGIMPGSAG